MGKKPTGQFENGNNKNTFPGLLLAAGVIYLVASLLHFWHNAEFMSEYPNLPGWLTRGLVYLGWLLTLVPCLLAVLAWRGRWFVLSLALFALWGALGYFGLDHYYIAPVSAHTAMANFTIVFELVAGTALIGCSLVFLVGFLRKREAVIS